jgi:cGMP-dependent protein kinase
MDSPRTCDVISKTNCILYSLSTEKIITMVGDKYREILYLNMIKMAFSKSNYFGKINPKLIENTFELFKMKNYIKGETVLKSGYKLSSKIIIIIEGNLINEKVNKLVFKRYDIAYENELTTNSEDKLNFDLIADPDCLIVKADKEKFFKTLGGDFNNTIKISFALDSLNSIPIFKNLSYDKLEILSKIIKVINFENGTRIITQGEKDYKLFIIKSGTIDVFINDNYIRTLNKNEFFGERALFFNEPRTATAIANGKVECFVLDSEELKLILEEKLTKYLKSRYFLQDNSIDIKDLEFVRELGKGNFGSVCLVHSRKNKFNYALKILEKKDIDEQVLHKNIEMEKNILLKIDHPFIVKLVKTLKDSKAIYFIMEYIRGKELFDVIRSIGLLDNSQTKFYACSMFLAIEYLHEKNFIYRDIKPENLMINENVNFFLIFFLLLLLLFFIFILFYF